MNITAIIPARSGSKGIPHKNIRPLAGHPLLAWSIAAATLAKRINRVLVSTDSEEYAAIARRYGAEAPFLRPAELARDESSDLEFVQHVLAWLQEHERSVPHYLVHLRPPCPKRDPAVVDAAIDVILADPDATSLCSAHAVDYPPCKYFKLDNDRTFNGYMGEEYVNIPRQLCVQAFKPNGYVDVLNVAGVSAYGTLHGPRRLAFIAPDPGDIDTEEEFNAVQEYLYSENYGLAKYLDCCSALSVNSAPPPEIGYSTGNTKYRRRSFEYRHR